MTVCTNDSQVIKPRHHFGYLESQLVLVMNLKCAGAETAKDAGEIEATGFADPHGGVEGGVAKSTASSSYDRSQLSHDSFQRFCRLKLERNCAAVSLKLMFDDFT